jgi:hypothetical protein
MRSGVALLGAVIAIALAPGPGCRHAPLVADGGAGPSSTDAGADSDATTCGAPSAQECFGTIVTGTPCAGDCQVPCGIRGIGVRTCLCGGDCTFRCSCPRPADYQGAATADYCDTADQTTTALQGTACARQWDECVGREPSPAAIPHGCICLPRRDGSLQWACGSSDGWFTLATGD